MSPTYSYDRRAATSTKLDTRTRSQANTALERNGLDGNGRFRKVGEGLSKAFDVLATFGIEQDETLNAHLFSSSKGQRSLQLAFTNREDSFSPTSISNSMLSFSWQELSPDRFEVLAYLS